MADKSRKLDQLAHATTSRFKAGPQPKPKPGEFQISGWEWWDNFWRSAPSRPPKQAERDLIDSEPPERRGMIVTVRDMTDAELKAYSNGRGWTNFPSAGPRGDAGETSVGTELLKDVVRKEYIRRGIPAHM